MVTPLLECACALLSAQAVTPRHTSTRIAQEDVLKLVAALHAPCLRERFGQAVLLCLGEIDMDAPWPTPVQRHLREHAALNASAAAAQLAADAFEDGCGAAAASCRVIRTCAKVTRMCARESEQKPGQWSSLHDNVPGIVHDVLRLLRVASTTAYSEDNVMDCLLALRALVARAPTAAAPASADNVQDVKGRVLAAGFTARPQESDYVVHGSTPVTALAASSSPQRRDSAASDARSNDTPTPRLALPSYAADGERSFSTRTHAASALAIADAAASATTTAAVPALALSDGHPPSGVGVRDRHASVAVTLRVVGDSVSESVRLELQHRKEAASVPPVATGILLSDDGCSEAASSSGPSACSAVQEAAGCVSVADCVMRAHAAPHARASASPAQARSREGRSGLAMACAATAGEGGRVPGGNASSRGSSSGSSAHSVAGAASRFGGEREIDLQSHDDDDGDGGGAGAPQASAQAAAAVANGDADANERLIEKSDTSAAAVAWTVPDAAAAAASSDSTSARQTGIHAAVIDTCCGCSRGTAAQMSVTRSPLHFKVLGQCCSARYRLWCFALPCRIR